MNSFPPTSLDGGDAGTTLSTTRPPTTAEAILALQKIVHFLEPYKIAIFALLPFICGSGWGWTSQYPPELWYQGLFLIGLTLVGFISPTPTFSGPIRFVYLEGNLLVTSLCQNLPAWSSYGILLSITFIPTARVSMMALVPVVWQYLLHKYRERVHDITEKVNKSCYRAALAAESAREHVKESGGYEKRALEMAVAARRDARLMQSLRITDYFDVAAGSWSALGQITAPLESTTRAARKVLEEAEACRDVELDDNDDDDDDDGDAERKDDSLAAMFLDQARVAVDTAEKMEEHARAAQAKVKESQDALKQDNDTRRTETENSQAVVETAQTLISSIKDISPGLSTTNEGAEKVKWLACQAKIAAEEGDFKAAASFTTEAEEEADKIVEAERQLFSAKESARRILRKLHLGKEDDSLDRTLGFQPPSMPLTAPVRRR